MHPDAVNYNKSLGPQDRAICKLLARPLVKNFSYPVKDTLGYAFPRCLRHLETSPMPGCTTTGCGPARHRTPLSDFEDTFDLDRDVGPQAVHTDGAAGHRFAAPDQGKRTAGLRAGGQAHCGRRTIERYTDRP